ncbi:T9SS type A sorting domain-containing protein [Aureitalea sp. L0-47]|uniref:T9SS type A sorting domain-containing protein n=1 Tax=Aureitalea sp. L0-47 TaxID=2816962 RepID=UPI002237E22E|nr:T9SS type A sorting domain-containing protein [Aureitalea sp. L0-47]MCW5520471.1 T9SS type A sorting domain-containing protein [Aureitalea sp. L0-47]
MKTITTFCVALALTMGLTTLAQQARTLPALLDVLTENHTGRISDVFTETEIQILRAHFDQLNGDEIPQTEFPGKMIRTTEAVMGHFANIMPTNLSMIQIVAPSPLSEFEGAGATIPGSKDAYVVDNNNNLYRVSDNGDYLFIGELSPNGAQSFTGLEFASDGTLYGIATDGMGSTRLYEINPMNQTVTPIGTDNGLVVGIALGRDASNNLYSYDIDSDTVHRIDRVTGNITLLGPLGFDANFGQGMGYDHKSGNLMMTAFNNGTIKPELRTVNTTTGATTLVGTIVPSQTLQFGWMSMFDPNLAVEDKSAIQFGLSPVPAGNYLDLNAAINIETVAIYNVLGQIILQETVNDSTARLDISNLNAGVYILEVNSNRSRSAKRFIKQ